MVDDRDTLAGYSFPCPPASPLAPARCALGVTYGQSRSAIWYNADTLAAGQGERALRGKGLSVPRDVAMIGFDSTALCDHTDPPLTSVRQPVYDMAAQALTLLVQRINGETPDRMQIRTLPEIVVRRSCGAQPAAPSVP